MSTRIRAGRPKKRDQARRAPSPEASVRDLVTVSSQWYYWEQDENFRFTVLTGSIFEKSGVDPHPYLGKTRWELGTVPVDSDGTWDKHKATLEARLPFSNLIFEYRDQAGNAAYFSSSGQPVYDARKRFTGYRGITLDITHQVRLKRRQAVEHGVARILADSNHIADAIPQILRTLGEIAGWACGAFWQLDTQTQALHCIHTWSTATPSAAAFLAATRRVSPITLSEAGLVRRSCAERKPIWTTQLGDDKTFLRAAAARSAGLSAAFAFPITFGRQVLGAIEFFSGESRQPDDDLLNSAIYVGASIGQFCQRKTAEDELLRFRAAMDMSDDLIYLVDRATMRFVDLNETAARANGLPRTELLKLGPHDVLRTDRAELERLYDEVIAKGGTGDITESYGYALGGRAPFEIHRQALRVGESWIIVTTARNIGARKLAERTTQQLSRMYAALGATNEAIMRAASPEDLFRRVCDAAVNDGKFVTTAIVVPDADAPWMKMAAVAGAGAAGLQVIRSATDDSLPEGRGLVGTALRTRAPCVTDDYGNDPRTAPWHDEARRAGIGAAAAVPLLRHDAAVGVLLFYTAEKHAFDDATIKLLQRMSRNVVFALDNFARDAERHAAQEAQLRFTRMYAALSATNEAIMRARSPEELYQLVCDAAVDGGKCSSTSVLLTEPETSTVCVAAVTGSSAVAMKALRLSIDANVPEGRGMTGPAIRSGKPTICNDLEADPRFAPWADWRQASGTRAGAALPIFRGGRTVGALVFFSAEAGAFDAEIVKLLERMAQNVSFALDNFEREAGRQRAEEGRRASDEKYRAVLETMYDGYYETDLAGNFTDCNDAFPRILRCNRDEVVGVSYRDSCDAETARQVFAVYNKIYRTGIPSTLTEWEFIRKDGTRGIWESSVQLIRDADGNPIGFRGVTRDVSSRREAEEALRASEERYRNILETMSDGYFEVDLAGNYTTFNEALCRMHGYAREEMLGCNYRDYCDPATTPYVFEVYNRIYRTGDPANTEWEFVRKSGERARWEQSVQLIVGTDGKPVGFRGITRDITRRHQAEVALRASEERYRNILETMSDGYFEVDLNGNYSFLNEAAFRMHGETHAAMIGSSYRGYYDEQTAQRIYDTYNQIYRTGQPSELTEWKLRRKDGKPAIYEASVQLLRDADGNAKGFRGVTRDITSRRQAEAALRASEERYRTILGSIADAYYETDLKGDLVLFNSALCELLGYSADELYGMNNRRYQTKEMAMHIYRTCNDLYRGGLPKRSYDWEVVCKDGTRVLVEGSIQLIKNAGGDAVGFRGILRDVTARRRIEHQLRESEARFRSLIELSTDWYWEFDADFRFARLEARSGGAAEKSRFDSDLGKRPWEVGIEAEDGWETQRRTLEAHHPFHDLVTYRTMPDGTRRYASIAGEPLFDANGRFRGYRGVGRDISERKRAEERIQYLATHDGLTALPNRVMFSQLLNNAIESARRYERNFAVLFIDLDRFKVINDTLGHDAGDKLLQEIGQRLRQTVRASDVVARLGGDEFVVLVQEVNTADQVAAIARKILSTVIKPIEVMGDEYRVTASIGICMYPADADDEQALMKHADMAMYLAKSEGKNNFQFYSKEIRTQSLERLILETKLRGALERNEFSLHYQAKLDFKTSEVTGVEALLRWNSPELGAVSPVQFIPLAEETGLIVPIGKWVLKTACEQNVAWQRQGLPPVCMAVNLSARQFADPDLLGDIGAALRETGMDARLLELEITEGMVIHNPQRTGRLLGAIREMGVHLAIDDFGTGYSSLGQLKNFPIDTLKVDRSFIRDLPDDAEDSAITKAIIAMGKTLSLRVIAEGVETEAQAQFLREHGCDEMQGYYFSRPIAPEAFAELLRTHTAAKYQKRA